MWCYTQTPITTHTLLWATDSNIAITLWYLIRCITNVFCVYSRALIFHLSLSLSRFLIPHLCLHLLSSLSAASLLLFSSLSLFSSWLGEITPPHQDTLSSLAGWWNTEHQSHAASLVVELMSWGRVFIWSSWSCAVLTHAVLPTTPLKHTPF